MKRSIINEVLLYKYRYIIGYILYAVALFILLSVEVTTIPRGLTQAEIQSSVQSATASIDSFGTQIIVDAPYILLQKLSLSILGLTTFAIKLPSILLAIVAGIALALMLRQWFRLNVAVLTGIIVATSTPFLTMGRTGTSIILGSFWLIIILLAATNIIHSTKQALVWKIVASIAVAMSLYTPLMIYPLTALAIAGLLHPHVRFLLRRISYMKLALAALGSLILITPLIYSAVKNPSLIYTLLGIPDNLPTMSGVITNLQQIAAAFLGFSSITADTYILPYFGAATMALILLGFLKLLVDRYSSRSYMLIIWIILLTPIVVINPDIALQAFFIPCILLIAIGLETLIRQWYRLFPKNPYARIAGLIPLTILLVSICTANVSRYFYGYLYAPQSGNFSNELSAVQSTLASPALNDKPVVLSVPEDQLAFFDLLRRNNPKLTVTTDTSYETSIIVLEKRHVALDILAQNTLGEPYRLIVNGDSKDALLARLYIKR